MPALLQWGHKYSKRNVCNVNDFYMNKDLNIHPLAMYRHHTYSTNNLFHHYQYLHQIRVSKIIVLIGINV